MVNARKRFATVLVVALILIGVFGALRASSSPTGVAHHYSCEGNFGVDHGIVTDARIGQVTYSHRMERTMTSIGNYRVTRIVYRSTNASGPTLDHTHVANGCSSNG